MSKISNRCSVHTDLKYAIQESARLLSQGSIIGWFQGASEFGPRALGHRSILADPRVPDIQEYLNESVKHREYWRPYAPVVLEEQANEWFDMQYASCERLMLCSVEVREDKRKRIPGVVHGDGTARVQTVPESLQPLHTLLTAFHALTDVPVLINTSLNGAGEPIVETPEDAVSTFSRMPLDALVIGETIISRLPEDTSWKM